MTDARYRQTYLARALADGHAEIIGEGRNERILYVSAGHSERWADPEEKVRAELWAVGGADLQVRIPAPANRV